MPGTAIVYARFSTSEQSKGFSLQRQTESGLAFATSKGWSVETTITDEGRSAFHGTNRLEGAALHQFELEARNGLHRGKTLIVENIDRLSRQGPKAAAQLIWGLNEHGVDVATYHDGQVYRGDENGDLLDVFKLIMSAQQSHQESVNKSKRTKDNWRNRFKKIAEGSQTEPVPHIPRWVDRERDGFVLNAHRATVLNEIYDLYIDGVGIHRIVCILNEREEESWTPKEGKRPINGWFYSYIYRLLTKRTVLGEYVMTDGTTVSPDFYPQAITAEKWNRAQAALTMRKGNQKTTKTQGNRNLLAQIVVCEQCGGGAHFRHTTDSPQKYFNAKGETRLYRRQTYRRLLCDRARRNLACDNKTVLNYDVVEETILTGLLPQLVDRRVENEEANVLRVRMAELLRQRDAAQGRLDNLIDALADGQSKSIMQRVAALEGEIEQFGDAIDVAQKSLAIETAKPASDDDVALINSLRDDLNSADDEVRIYARGRANMTLRRLIKRVAITPTGLFRIVPDDNSWFLFDAEGRLIGDETAVPLR